MPGKVIGRTLNLGFVGNLSRSSDNVIIARTANDEIPFGRLVVINPDNTVELMKSVDEISKVIGVSVRIVKQETSISEEVKYLKDETVDILSRGSITVVCDGTPRAGENVYCRLDSDENIIFTTDDSETELENFKFTTGQKDSNEMVEITITERRL